VKYSTFSSQEFMVASVQPCPEFGNKAELEVAIVRHGGRKVQNYGPRTTYRLRHTMIRTGNLHWLRFYLRF
jgi:hypothetical protein